LLEVRPGLGTVVAQLPASTAAARGNLLKKEVEELVVEAKRLGLDLEDVTDAVAEHWQRLDAELSSLWTTQRFTVVFVTHSIQEAVFLSTRVAVMAAHPGRIVQTVTIDAPFPRDDDFRVSPAFADLARRLSASVAQASAAVLPDAREDVA
jgi:ABC-type sulfate/molybdate transport systems ATPase subunit